MAVVLNRVSSAAFSRYLLLMVLMLVSIATLLYFTTGKSINDINKATKNIAIYDVNFSSLVIEKQLTELRRSIELFSLSFDEEISSLMSHPRSTAAAKEVASKLEEFFPHAKSFVLTNNKGETVYIQEQDEFFKVCDLTVRHHARGEEAAVEVHTQGRRHHLDIVSKLNGFKSRGYLVVSIDADIFKPYLDTPAGHQLMLIKNNGIPLIEITSAGARAGFKGDIFLSETEESNILSSKKIPGTNWLLVDIKDDVLLSLKISQSYMTSLLVFLGFTFFMVISAYLLFVKDRQLQSIESEYRHYKGKVDDVIAEKTADLRDANARLEHLSLTDGLTGIANRRHLDLVLSRELRRAIRHNKQVALLLLDIDFFKRYNDSLGHVSGDKCLQLIAAEINDEFRRGGDLAARYGGEEFAIILPEISVSDVDRQAERVRVLIKNLNIEHPDSEISDWVTVSVGVTVLVKDEFKTMEELMKDADAALYRAKSSGRNCCYRI